MPPPPPRASNGKPGAEVEIDRNGDGKIDYEVFYDRAGTVEHEEFDFN